MESELWLAEAKFVFTQPGNTSGTTDEYEELIVEVEGIEDVSKENFLVIRTNGWSIDEPKELVNILKRVKKMLEVKNENR